MEKGTQELPPEAARLVVKHYLTLTKAPYGLQRGLEEVRREDGDGLGKIILETSEEAWRAYFVAQKISSSDRGFYTQVPACRTPAEVRERPCAGNGAWRSKWFQA
jgi:hypothetical protein